MADGGGDLAAAAAAGGASHPLQYRWTLWYDNSASARKNRFASWDENLTELMTFGTVEEFWALFNNILEPSNLAASSNYHLFKEGIAPKWEDPANSEGGKWVLMNPPSYKERLDQYWIHTVLTVIGEGFDAELSEDIAGLVLSTRRQADRISMWTKTSADEPLQKRIGEAWRATATPTGLHDNVQLEYLIHKDSIANCASLYLFPPSAPPAPAANR